MKIKRYLANDMRQAIRMVREEQGPDAVILSNRRIDGGVEIVAAIDYDESLVQRMAEEAGIDPRQPHKLANGLIARLGLEVRNHGVRDEDVRQFHLQLLQMPRTDRGNGSFLGRECTELRRHSQHH